MTDKEKLQKDIMKDVLLLETGGFKVIQGNFNFTILKKEWWRINPKKLFIIKFIKTRENFKTVGTEELKTLASELNSGA